MAYFLWCDVSHRLCTCSRYITEKSYITRAWLWGNVNSLLKTVWILRRLACTNRSDITFSMKQMFVIWRYLKCEKNCEIQISLPIRSWRLTVSCLKTQFRCPKKKKKKKKNPFNHVQTKSCNITPSRRAGYCRELEAAGHKYVLSSNAICWTNISDVTAFSVSVSKSSFALKRNSRVWAALIGKTQIVN